MPSSQLLSSLIFGFLLLLVLAPLAFALWWHLRLLWVGWQLRQRGVPVPGQVTGRRQSGAATQYQIRFTTPAGQIVEGYSQGQHLLDPGYADAALVGIRYEPARPQRFMLESELRPHTLLSRLGLVLLALLLLYWALR